MKTSGLDMDIYIPSNQAFQFSLNQYLKIAMKALK